ncbi:pseudouridine synthase Rsu, putative [Acanthamoeba castellanii str. Neff]|uniref:Pseudouridine synthase Rsu, putative n=1 Tax=Acanthamoeba castellanii (strain ATCC 30010 / Neff) TaxID=1257118 RepID=L8GUA8_ACACF|nr:pseudouridine synthase Rsu, putative [Acanthamoeba castellanii str. Neff]ELR16203.1 pseudouridine synthase Rsu, putative [Acanthamoeba castellanii str. Neff]
MNCAPLFPLRSSSARRYNTSSSGTASRSRPTHAEEARPKDHRHGGQDVKKSSSVQRTGRNKAVEPKAEAKEVVSATENGTTRNVLPADGPYRLVERLAKRIARSGLCSRREAERLIEEGLVSVDGAIVKTPAINVTPASVVMINNKKVWLHYKKRGVLVTHHDPQGREALFPHLRNMGLPHLVSVGRLDYTSEGLLLLTNNGRLAQYLEHPSNEYERKYKVRIRGKLSLHVGVSVTRVQYRVEQKVIDRLAKGITVGGVEYGPIKVTPIEKRRSEEETSTNEWVYVSLTEGKNREIRRVFEHFKLVVTRLIRVQPYTLDKKLEPGDVVETRLRLDLVKKADRDGDQESSTVPFPESYFRIDPRKIITSLPTPASSAKPPSVPALDSPPSSTSQE